jgi:predicted metal-dependent phosphoesterase TrpH
MKRSFVNPFKETGKWFKGNVHAHTTHSDGTRTPEQLVEIYREAGYHFLSITDHSVVTDTGGLEGEGLLLIPGTEMCVGRSHANTTFHLVALGVRETLPFKDFDRDLNPQMVVDYVNDVGGIPILAHPYWSGLNHRDMMDVEGYHGVEIYNTSCEYERNTGLSLRVREEHRALRLPHRRHHSDGETPLDLRGGRPPRGGEAIAPPGCDRRLDNGEGGVPERGRHIGQR